MTPRRRAYEGENELFLIFSTPHFKSIQAFWDELWVLEWSKFVFPPIYDHSGTSSDRIHRLKGEITPRRQAYRG